MKKETNAQQVETLQETPPPSSNGNSVLPPTRDEVVAWVKRDIHAATYFLSVLQRYPEIIEKLGEEIYITVNQKENGAAIDHLNHK